MPNSSAIFTILLSVLLAIGGIWGGYNLNLLPDQASTNAPVYDELFQILFVIGTILFVGMTTIVIYSLIKFRRKPGDTNDGLNIEGNINLEIFWTAVPAIIVLFVGLYSYDIYDRMGGMQPLAHSDHNHAEMNAQEKIWGGIGSGPVGASMVQESIPLPVELSAMQFAFIFHYPKGDIITGELHLPVGQKVSMKMESKDVIHAFWVPQFRLKQDVIPGQPTILNFTPTKVGNFPIVCAELCGPYHGGMRSTVVVEKTEDFDKWFEQNAKSPVSEL